MRRAPPVVLSLLALTAGAAALAPGAVADWTVGVCVYPMTSHVELELEGYPPGNQFVGVYVGPGTDVVYTNRGQFVSACTSGGARDGGGHDFRATGAIIP